MIWLQGSRWARWAIAGLIAAGALWTEFADDPSIEHPFAAVAISRGDEISASNVEMRKIPSGILEPVSLGSIATRRFDPGEPIIAKDVSDRGTSTINGWWTLEVDLPGSATAGDEVKIILLDSGIAVTGVVDGVRDDDPLGSGRGSVAIPLEHAASVAAAQASGRIAILVSTG